VVRRLVLRVCEPTDGLEFERADDLAMHDLLDDVVDRSEGRLYYT